MWRPNQDFILAIIGRGSEFHSDSIFREAHSVCLNFVDFVWRAS